MMEMEEFDFISWKKSLNNGLFNFWQDISND